MLKFVVAATAMLMVCALIPTDSFAKKTTKATARSYNACVQLAQKRGFNSADIQGDSASEVKGFVRRCMRGEQV